MLDSDDTILDVQEDSVTLMLIVETVKFVGTKDAEGVQDVKTIFKLQIQSRVLGTQDQFHCISFDHEKFTHPC